jgi:hypothetical protein
MRAREEGGEVTGFRPSHSLLLKIGSGYNAAMTKLLRDAISQVEKLPDGEQDAAATAMLDYLAHKNDLRVSDADLVEIRRRRADPNRKLVSHDEFNERLRRLIGS